MAIESPPAEVSSGESYSASDILAAAGTGEPVTAAAVSTAPEPADLVSVDDVYHALNFISKGIGMALGSRAVELDEDEARELAGAYAPLLGGWAAKIVGKLGAAGPGMTALVATGRVVYTKYQAYQAERAETVSADSPAEDGKQ